MNRFPVISESTLEKACQILHECATEYRCDPIIVALGGRRDRQCTAARIAYAVACRSIGMSLSEIMSATDNKHHSSVVDRIKKYRAMPDHEKESIDKAVSNVLARVGLASMSTARVGRKGHK